MRQKGLFITFEGIDGSGKSTHVELLADYLKKQGKSVYATIEPTNGNIGKMIRKILRGEESADHKTIAGLFVADRLDHILNKKNGLLKKINDGCIVITDRFYLSSFAYQSVHAPLDWLIHANALSISLLKPDAHFFIDISPEISMKRIMKGRDSTELFENMENLKVVRANYFNVFKRLKNEENIIIIDGNQSKETIARQLIDNTCQLLKSKAI